MKASAFFDGKNVYVTGGSSGIGLATAREAASFGANVMIIARNEERLHVAAEEIGENSSPGRKTQWMSVDVTDAAATRAAFDRAVSSFGPPDILVNCAGRARPDYFENIDTERFESTLRLNLLGVRNCVAAALSHMKPGGYIVNVASVAGLIGVFGYTDYSASKFAVVGFSEALRAELKPKGITVSVLCPPDTDTPGLKEENLTKPPETKAISASASMLSAEQVAKALVKGMLKKRFIIIPGLDARLSVLAKRLFPHLVAWVMDRTVMRVNKKGKTTRSGHE